jgi:putative membrane protein
MKNIRNTFAAVAVSLGLLTACNSDNSAEHKADSLSPATPDSGMNTATGGDSSSATKDAAFLQEAYTGGMKEIAVSEQAKSKAQSKEAKSLADMMIAAHTDMNNKIKALAAQKNVTLPAQLPQSDMDMINKNTKTGKDFDKDFAATMVDDHQKTIAKFEQEVANGMDADAKALASAALPDLKKHLEHSLALQEKVK